MLTKINQKRLWIYLAFAFGISWLTALVIFLTGGLENSLTIDLDGTPLSLAFILLSTAYMFGPALANLFTRLITREGKAELLLQPNFDRGRWIYWLMAWLLPVLLTILGAVIFFVIFPKYYDPDFGFLKEQLAASGSTREINPWLIIISQITQAVVLSPILNSLSTFGEEFGWRAYLQPKLMPLGARKAVLLTGAIWGIWHWPVILMGYNYGLNYFGAPILGPLAMVWFTLSLGVIFGWLSAKTQSVWPAVIAHSAINGIAAIGILMAKGQPSSLLGPAPTGIIGGLALTLVAVILLIHPRSFSPYKQALAEEN